MKKFSWILIFVCALFLFSSYAYGLSLDPSRVEITVPANEMYVGKFIVENTTKNPASYRVTVEDLVITSQSGPMGVKKGATSRSCGQWLVTKEREFMLKPGEKKELKYVLDIPKDVSGGYYALLFFEESQEAPQKGALSFAVRIGAPLYLTIKGTEIKKAEISEVEIKTPKKNDIVATFTVELNNLGNVHLRPQGQVILKKGKDKVAELKLVPGILLPQAKREYVALWKADLKNIASGEYEAIVTVDIGEEKKLSQKKIFRI